MPGLQFQDSITVNSNPSLYQPNIVIRSNNPVRILRYAYYAFVFSAGLEGVEIGGLFTVSKAAGYLFVATALLQPSVCFRRPPKAFWYFVIYLCIFAIFGMQYEAMDRAAVMQKLMSLAQMIIMFWLSYNMLQYGQVAKGALLALAASCISLAILLMLGSIGEVAMWGIYERTQTEGMDANTFGAILSLGLLALVGLAYGRKAIDKKTRWLFWSAFVLLAIPIVSTGSRGTILSLATGLVIFLLKHGSMRSRLKAGLIAVLAIGSLTWLVYHSEVSLLRWQATLSEGNLSGREEIFPAAWEMFLEKPLAGWGPEMLYELGRRTGKPLIEPHNLYLWLLVETGLAGAIPFFVGLWLCLRAAWKGRSGNHGVLPLAMLVSVLMVNLSITWHGRKIFWVVVAYALASASDGALPQLLRVVRQAPPSLAH